MDTLNYEEVVRTYPWILERDQNCILSPDSDGLLCGLLMSHCLGWKVKGYYDGKVLVVERGTSPRDCVFLDMEIFRKGVRSVGQHMVMFNRDKIQPNWNQFSDCISANNLRNFDVRNEFMRKYPLGTIHLLLGILGSIRAIPIKKEAVAMLLYTDGTFKNQFNYPENVMSWLTYMGAERSGSPLKSIFMDPHYSTYELMQALAHVFGEFKRIGNGARGGDKIRISDGNGTPQNIDPVLALMHTGTRAQAEATVGLLAHVTGWQYDPTKWYWGPYDTHVFQKGSATPGLARYNAILAQNPLSLAVTGMMAGGIQYTLDPNNVF